MRFYSFTKSLMFFRNNYATLQQFGIEFVIQNVCFVIIIMSKIKNPISKKHLN